MSTEQPATLLRCCCIQLNQDVDADAFMKRTSLLYPELSPERLTDRRVRFTGEKVLLEHMILIETSSISWHTFAATTPQRAAKLSKIYMVRALTVLVLIGIAVFVIRHVTKEKSL